MGFERLGWRRAAIVLVIALLVMFAALAVSSAVTSDGWMRYAISESPSDDPLPIMAADGSGTLHILYTGETEDGHFGQGYLAEGSGRDWTIQAVPTGRITTGTSMAFGASGTVHIADFYDYDEIGNDAVEYTTDAGGTWSREVHEVGGTAFCSRIAVDADDAPVIITVNRSFDYTTTVLGLNPNDGGWGETVICTLEEGWVFNGMSAIMTDPEGGLHAFLARYEAYTSNWAMDEIVLEDGAWNVIERPSPGEGTILFSAQSGVIDGAGNVHITFIDVVEGQYTLDYAMEQAYGWAVEEVTDSDALCHPPTITVDAAGTVYLAYSYFGSDGDGGTAYAVRGSGGVWNETKVDTQTPPSLSATCTIVVDGSGGVHICAELRTDETGGCAVVYITDTEPGILMNEWFTHAAVLTALAALIVGAPFTAMWYLSAKNKKRNDGLEKAGLNDRALR